MSKDIVYDLGPQPIATIMAEHGLKSSDLVSNSTGNSLKLTIERQNRKISMSIAPEETSQQDIFGRQHKHRRIGVGAMPINNVNDIVVEIRFKNLGLHRKLLTL